MGKKVIGLLCFVVTGVLLWGLVNKNSKSIEDIKVGKPAMSVVGQTFQCSGTVEGDEVGYISPSCVGTVDEVFVVKGQRVLKNDLLFTLVTDQGTESYYAPFNGVCGIITIQKGQHGIPELSFVQLISEENLVVRIHVDEKNLSAIKEGQNAKIELKAFPEKSYWGVIKSISSYAESDGNIISRLLNQDSTTVTATIEFEDGDQKLIPGLSADVTIISNIKDRTLLLPCSAILRDESGYYVFEVDDGLIVRTEIVKGDYRSGYYLIPKGIHSEKEYVLNPNDDVKKGDRVNLNE